MQSRGCAVWPQGPSISTPGEGADAGIEGDEAEAALGDTQLLSIFKIFLKAFTAL